MWFLHWLVGRFSRVEIRRLDDGTLDEVVLWVVGVCVFHLEKMDDYHWWAGLYSREDTHHLRWICHEDGNPIIDQ